MKKPEEATHGDHKVVEVDTPEGKFGVVLIDHREAEERVMRAMYQIRKNTDLLGIGTMSDRIRKYIPMMIPTCATDGKHVLYNPLFVENMLQTELRFVMLHEIMHVAYSHHLRLQERNIRVANIAMDYMVNGILLSTKAYKDGFIEPPTVPGRKEIWLVYDAFFVDKKWSFETIYDYLLANADKYPMVQEALDAEKNKDTCPVCGGSRLGQGDDEDDGDEKSQSESSDGGDGGDGDDEKSEHEGSGSHPSKGGHNEDHSHGPSQKKCECKGEQGSSARPGGMSGYGMWGEVWPASQEVLDKAKQEHEEIQNKLAEGEFMEKSWGPTGGTDQVCGTMRESDEDTQGWYFLKEYLRDVYSHDHTWARPNLLRIKTGYYPTRDTTAGTLHVALDTSGSVSERELKIYLANVQVICEQVGVGTLKIAYIDSVLRRSAETGEIWQVIDIDAGEEIEFTIMGRGGTQFDPVFLAIEEEQEDVSCLIYFTDGWGACTVPEPDFPVIWATSQDEVQWWGDHGKWGEQIDVTPASW